jgi:hypothetical protein
MSVKNKLGFDKGHRKPLGIAKGRKEGMRTQISRYKKYLKEQQKEG